MKVADVVNVRGDGSFLIPSRLREFVGGFEVGTEVWFHPVESIFYGPSPDPNKEWIELSEPKLFISVIKPRCWPHLYDVDISLGDSKGSLEKALEMLSENKISVIMGESRTTLCRVRAEATLILDFKKFKRGLGTIDDLNQIFAEEIRKNPGLREYIKPIERTVDKEIWVKGKKSPLQDLAIDGKEFTPGRVDKPGRDEIIEVPTQSSYTKVKRAHTVKLPKGLINKFAMMLRRDITSSWAIITASSETKMLQLTFPEPDAKIVKMSFHLKNGAETPGSLLKLANFLVSKDFDFLETRMSILEFAQEGLWIVIADIKSSEYSDTTSKEDLKKRLMNDLLNVEHDLGLYDKSNPFRHFELYLPEEKKQREPRKVGFPKFLSVFEPEFRVLIQKQLEEKYGESWWKRGIPPDVKQRAQEKIQREKPEEEYSPLDFVEFSDYQKIISRRDNWRLIFRNIFPDKAWAHTKLSELNDIRNRFAHSRRTTKRDSRRFNEIAREILEKFEDFAT